MELEREIQKYRDENNALSKLRKEEGGGEFEVLLIAAI